MRKRFLMNVENSIDITRDLAVKILYSSQHEVFNADFLEAKRGSDTNQKVKYLSKVTRDWARMMFCDSMNWVSRSKTGDAILSPVQRAKLHKHVSYHMGKLQRGHAAGEWKEDEQHNLDQRHCEYAMEL